MLKKRTILSVASILCVCLLVGGYFVIRSISSKIAVSSVSELKPDVPDAPDRELIDPSEKVLLSDERLFMASRLAPPCLELYAWGDKHPKLPNVGIIEGKIVYEEEWEHPTFKDAETNEAMHEKYGVGMTTIDMVYTLDLEHVWYGDIPESQQQMQFFIGGEEDTMITKPEVGEHVLMFLYMEGERYTSLDVEHAIFTMNDDGTLYSFSNEEALYQYDGQPVQNLVDDFYRILDETEATPYFDSSGYIDE